MEKHFSQSKCTLTATRKLGSTPEQRSSATTSHTAPT